MSEEVKRYELTSEELDSEEDGYIQSAEEWADGEYVKFSDLESERQAHEQTKKQLEALEDWVEGHFELVGKSVVQPKRFTTGGFREPYQAITNSRARKQG